MDYARLPHVFPTMIKHTAKDGEYIVKAKFSNTHILFQVTGTEFHCMATG
jgi:hypothetical protein